MVLLVLVAVAAVLFVAAVVATQEGDVLLEAPPDRPDVDLPAGHVVAEDLRSVRFGMVLRGYRMSEVDDVLERLGGELAERDERIADLERTLAEVVEPAVAEAEAGQAASPEPASPPEPEAASAPEPVLPPSLAPSLAPGARDGEAPAEAPASGASPLTAAAEPEREPAGPAQLSPLDLVRSYHVSRPPVPSSAEPQQAPEPHAPEEPPAAAAEPSPLDPRWDPTAAQRTLDLAASYRISMPGGGSPRRPEPEPTPPEPAQEAVAAEPVAEEELGFPEVEPAEPAARWAPQRDEGSGPDRLPTEER